MSRGKNQFIVCGRYPVYRRGSPETLLLQALGNYEQTKCALRPKPTLKLAEPDNSLFAQDSSIRAYNWIDLEESLSRTLEK